MQQYFINQIGKLNSYIIFSKEQTHHIQKVMRMKEKETIKVVDVNGTPFLAYVSYVEQSVQGYCYQCLTKKEESPEITLIQGMIKKDKWDFLLQKTCELGVNLIIPMIASRTIVKISSKDISKLERYNKIAMEACEQCKRDNLTKVHDPISFNDIKKYKKELNIIAYEDADFHSQALKEVLKANANVKSILYVIGSEGGFSQDEVNLLKQEGFICVSLGERILRAETAAISVVDITRYEFD